MSIARFFKRALFIIFFILNLVFRKRERDDHFMLSTLLSCHSSSMLARDKTRLVLLESSCDELHVCLTFIIEKPLEKSSKNHPKFTYKPSLTTTFLL